MDRDPNTESKHNAWPSCLASVYRYNRTMVPDSLLKGLLGVAISVVLDIKASMRECRRTSYPVIKQVWRRSCRPTRPSRRRYLVFVRSAWLHCERYSVACLLDAAAGRDRLHVLPLRYRLHAHSVRVVAAFRAVARRYKRTYMAIHVFANTVITALTLSGAVRSSSTEQRSRRRGAIQRTWSMHAGYTPCTFTIRSCSRRA